MIILHILISIVFYFILLYVSVNLLGLFVRGLFPNRELNKLELEGDDFIKSEIKKSKRADKNINIIAIILIIVYLYLLFHFWNIGVVVVAIMIMLGRLPDLLLEIKFGKKIDRKSGPGGILSVITPIFLWGALPVLYYFLYHF